jgi:G3E family GTPase
MGAVTNVILITGFLGSGKTTFLNRVIKTFPEDQKLMILMNEFGEIGLDGSLIEGDDLDILEISKGSIFCVCVKTDFIRALNEIAQDLKPDVLIVESTGVANPSDLKKDLKLSIFKNRFQMKDQICLIDAAYFEDAYETFVSVEKQIASSTLFVINKVDLVPEKTVSAIKAIVGTHHPSPQFYETTYADIPMDRFYIKEPSGALEADTNENLSSRELDDAIEKLLENPDANATPPDRLLSAVYSWKGGDIDAFKSMVPLFPEKLIRAKGILSHGATTYLFNLVMSQHTIEVYSPGKDCTSLMNNIVFIGSPEVIDALEILSRKYPDLAQKSVFDPMLNN